MTRFIVNRNTPGPHEVEAATWQEDGSFVIFFDAAENRVFGMPTQAVQTIERLESA